MSKFVHALTIERTAFDEGVIDEHGQPTPQAATTSSIMGLVQPKSRIDEMEDHRSAGSEVGDHVIFIPGAPDVEHADAILYGTERYNIVGVRRFRYGGLAHVEIDARLITPTPTVAVGS
jgi:hypothetical protein